MDENEWRRLTRYIAGEGTDDERRETERWIAALPARAELASRLRTGWERAAEPSASYDIERAWGQVVRRKTVRSAPETVPPAASLPVRRPLFAQINRPLRWRWVGVAAAAVFTFAAGAVWRAVSPGLHPQVEAGPMRTVTTPRGGTAEVYLSDGTHVRLGAASTLRFPTTFGGERHVSLEGEGYFDVVHDPREFAVHTARGVARDIGTRFSVRAYPGSLKTEVVVAEGAVALKANPDVLREGVTPDSLVLTQSDLGRVDAVGALTVTHRVNVDDYLAWMRGRLVFADIALRDVLPQLNRWYGIEMTFGDTALANVRLTATLDLESLPDALQRLSALLDARIERQGDIVVLYAKR